MMELSDVYGSGADTQIERYRSALDLFMQAYGPGPVMAYRAPGRVNLIGEHTDYNHGFVLPAALDRDTVLLARPRADSVVVLRNVEEQYPPITFEVGPSITSGPRGDWGNYARGAAQMLAGRRDATLHGLDGLVAGVQPHGVPRGAGLSSSSALTVTVAIALAHLNHLPATGVEFAQLCSQAEWYVGTRGGIMDHFIAMLAQRDHAMFLDCRPDGFGKYSMEHVPLPTDFRLLVVNSGVRHENARGEYNHRVAACRAGVALLRSRFPAMTHLRDVQEVAWQELAPSLPEEASVGELWERGLDLGDLPGLSADTPLKVQARCRHVWTENRRVLGVMAALHTGDVSVVGRLLDEAHNSARDDYEVSCPELECLVSAAREVDGVAGARLTGAGWGGCIVALVRADAVPAFETHVQASYREQTGGEAAVFACRSGCGAGPISEFC